MLSGKKKHELTDQDIQRLIEGLRTDPKIREMIFESKGCETRTSTRSKCEQFVEEKLAYRSYGFETPKYYAKLIADIIDILVYKMFQEIVFVGYCMTSKG